MNFKSGKTRSLWIDQITSKRCEIKDPYVSGKRIVLLGESSHEIVRLHVCGHGDNGFVNLTRNGEYSAIASWLAVKLFFPRDFIFY